MARTGSCLLLCLAFVCRAAPVRGGEPGRGAVGPYEARRWRADLRFMAEEMPRWHANLFHAMTRGQFEDAVRKLDERIPSLARHQIIFELARVVAMAGDGHTNVSPTRDPKIGFHTLPVKFYLFKDGLFVRAARHEFADLVGARDLRVGGATADEAIARVRPAVARDNEMGVRFFAPMLLGMPEVLHAAGLAESVEVAEFVLEKAGRRRKVRLGWGGPAELLPPDTDLSWLPREGWADLRGGAAPPPRWLKDQRNKFWFEYLPDEKAVYAQINQVGDKDTESLEAFSDRLFDFVDSRPVDRLVLDLRLNRGGNGTLLRPLLRRVVKSKVDRPGHLFALIGRGTWSAAQFLVNFLEKYTDVVFVGEPTGSKGNTYGDSRKITLPNSGLTVRVSVYHWQDWHPLDARPWTAPRVTAELSSEDYRSNADPALKAALAYVPKESLAQALREAAAAGGAALAVKRFREFKAEPSNKYADVEEPLLLAGSRLLDAGKPDQAGELFRLNADENPLSPLAWFALGEACFQSGDRERAAGCFRKALQLNPKYYDAAERLKQSNAK